MEKQLSNTLGPQKRILVVDDNEHIRVSLSDSLSIFGYEVVTASDGVKGYELLLQNRFDLVITDCQIPEIDGWHLVDLIKERRPYTPVLMITGQSREEILEKMTTGQVDFLMFKPFRMEELHHIVQSFLVNNSSERNTTKICKDVYQTSV
jgi:DNA-binding NtrC family response regulator